VPLKEEIKTDQERRREKEKKIVESGANNAYPDYENLLKERGEKEPYLLFTIKDTNGNVVRKLTEKPKVGLSRIQWDLSYPSK